METENEKRMEEALKIVFEYNNLNNDLDAYLFDVIQWGLGDLDKKPNREDFGI